MADTKPDQGDLDENPAQESVIGSPVTHIQNIHYHGAVFHQQGDIVGSRTDVTDSNIQSLAVSPMTPRRSSQQPNVKAVQELFRGLSTELEDSEQEKQSPQSPSGEGTVSPREEERVEKKRRSLKQDFERNKCLGKCLVLVNDQNYREALMHLREMGSMETDHWQKIQILLLTIECDIMCEKHRAIVKTMDKLIECALAWETTAAEIIDIAKSYLQERKYIQASVLFYSATELLHKTLKGEELIKSIANCIKDAAIAIKAMMNDKSMEKTKKTIAGHLCHALQEAAQKIASVRGVDRRVLGMEQACSFYNVAICYSSCGDWAEHVDNNQIVRDIMIEHYGGEEETYRLYAFCLHSLGVAYHRLGEMEKAAEMWKASLQACSKVTDWETKTQKKVQIENTTKAFKEVIKYIKPTIHVEMH